MLGFKTVSVQNVLVTQTQLYPILDEVSDWMDEKSKITEADTVKATTGAAPAKSFMTAGPTLHYSHTNVLWLWFLAVLVYVAACGFWYAIVAGGPVSISLSEFTRIPLFDLGHYTITPISIYEYPWQIVVLGTLMGILAVIPVLASQLLSFRYSVALVLALMFIAKLYLFGVFVLVSCIAVASRPLRFRSRFISLALCMAPQLIYWAIWGGDRTADPVRWGFSFAPWIFAWLIGLAMAAVVLGVGHFTRYKPGLNWLAGLAFLSMAFGVFQRHIGFAELDYYRYIAGSDPADAVEFQDQSIADVLDKVLADISLRSRLEGQFFQFNDPAELRLKLKGNIQDMLTYNNRWPGWFQHEMPDRLNYRIRRAALRADYRKFASHWDSNAQRMPTVIYFRAVLSEVQPDVSDIVDQEMLRFYSDYPFADNILNWRDLFDRFPDSPESLEARWRIATDEAGKGHFDIADEYCQTAQVMIDKVLDELSASGPDESGSIFAAFKQPSLTIMTPFKLGDLQIRFRKLQSLIGKENRGDSNAAEKRLAAFLRLNPYDERHYAVGLDGLLEGMSQTDGLRDNLLLARAMRAEDIHRRLQLLEELTKQYPQGDAGIQAQYEVGTAKIKLWKNPGGSEEEKKQLLIDSHTILSEFIEKHPECPFSKQAAAMLRTLPQPQ
ncbi:MAG: hypothetical protein DRP52_05460 [Planctomycetota bacterium]|nr:MAG: hypothetical protein DRP52_05460 [Planctomycetota bacterium]